MKRGQFGSLLTNILFWLFVIGMFIWIIKTWIVGGGMHAIGPLETITP